MAKNGYKAFDNDMHVFEPADLYIKYMNPKWSERIPHGKPRTKHGMTRYFGETESRSARRVALSDNVSRLEGDDYGLQTLSADTPHGVSA